MAASNVALSAYKSGVNAARSRKSGKRRKAKMTIPLALVAGFLPAVNDIRKNAQAFGGILPSAQHTIAGLIGYDTAGGKYVGWRQASAAGAGGILAGFLVHYGAGKLGLNRMIARAGVPLLRI